jgi:hypothetical protein
MLPKREIRQRPERPQMVSATVSFKTTAIDHSVATSDPGERTNHLGVYAYCPKRTRREDSFAVPSWCHSSRRSA